jgi:hypothetical protein
MKPDQYGRIIGTDGLCHCAACERWRAQMPDPETMEMHIARLTALDLKYAVIGSRRHARFVWEVGDLQLVDPETGAPIYPGGSPCHCPCGCGLRMIPDAD